jgi:chromosome segregation ATPase
LRSTFKSSADSVIREFEKERREVALIRDVEQSRFRALEQRLRAARLKQAELDNANNHHQNERERLDRVWKELEQNRRNWQEDPDPQSMDERLSLKEKLLYQLGEVRREIAQRPFEDLMNAIDDGLKVVQDEGDDLRAELNELESLNQLQVMRTQTLQFSESRVSRKKSALAIEAQSKLAKLRRQREDSRKDTSIRLR